jgi:hypothetical protein
MNDPITFHQAAAYGVLVIFILVLLIVYAWYVHLTKKNNGDGI